MTLGIQVGRDTSALTPVTGIPRTVSQSVALVVGSVYSPSNPLLLLGFLWFSREASVCCLEVVPDSVFGVTSLADAVRFWRL